MRKRTLIVKLAILFTVSFIFSGCTSSTTQNSGSTSEKNVLKIGTEGTYSPFSFYNDKNELVGFDVDIARAVAKKIGYKAEFVDAPWDAMLAAFDANKTDVLFNQVAVTDERKEKYDFSTPYNVSHAAIIVNKETNSIQDLSDLKGKKSAQTITSNYAQLAEENGATIVSTDGFSKSVELVENGQADVTLNNDITFYDYLNQKPDAKIKLATVSDEKTEIAVAIHKNNPELVKKINTALKELEEEGTLKEISNKYFKKDITN